MDDDDDNDQEGGEGEEEDGNRWRMGSSSSGVCQPVFDADFQNGL